MLVCPICKNDFEKSPKARRQTYCSEKCRDDAQGSFRSKWNRTYLEKKRNENTVTCLCENCGNPFESYFYSGMRQKFCNDYCKIEFHKNQKLAELREQADLSPKPCQHCGRSFVPKYNTNHTRQIYCNDICKKEYHKLQAHLKAEQVRHNTIKMCPICDTQFTPKKTLKEIYCSPRCRKVIGKKIYRMMRECYKAAATIKEDHSHKVLGYTPKQLLEHLQTFPNWDVLKHESWHLDHKFPIIAFVRNGIKDPSIICHLENLQPLSGKENCSKNDNYDTKKFERWLSSVGYSNNPCLV